MKLKVTTADGKYIVTQNNRGVLSALRYGTPWRDLTGDNLIHALASDLVEARQACKCALADLQGLMPDAEPGGERQHPGWKTMQQLQYVIDQGEGDIT